MIVDNEYIEKGGSEGIDKPTKKKHAANKKPRKKKKKSSAFGQFLDKIDRKKVKSTLGVISILFAIYIVLACFSY